MKEKKIWLMPKVLKLKVSNTKKNKHKSVNESTDENGTITVSV